MGFAFFYVYYVKLNKAIYNMIPVTAEEALLLHEYFNDDFECWTFL